MIDKSSAKLSEYTPLAEFGTTKGSLRQEKCLSNPSFGQRAVRFPQSTREFLHQVDSDVGLHAQKPGEGPRGQSETGHGCRRNNVCRPRLLVQQGHLTEEVALAQRRQQPSLATNLGVAIYDEIEPDPAVALLYDSIAGVEAQLLPCANYGLDLFVLQP